MIEVQIKSKQTYNELKQYAGYHSDLTQVCSFRDELCDLLKEHNVEFDDKRIIDDKLKPILTISGRNVMKLENATPEMLFFVGVRSEFDPTISLKYMNEVRLLIKNDLVTVSDKFKNVYSKIGYRGKVSDLICANVKFYGKGKLTDFIDPNATLMQLKFNECREKPIIYKQINLKITSPMTSKDRYNEFVGKDTSGNKVTLKFYNKPNILKSIAFKNNEISIATTKVIVKNGTCNEYTVTDPIILPKGLTFIKDIMYSPRTRAIPVDLFRNAYYEFAYRYNAE